MQDPRGMLVFFNCGSNNGYSIAWWEEAFWEMGCRITGNGDRVHFAYTTLEDGIPAELKASNVIQFQSHSGDKETLSRIGDYVREHGIELAFGFDRGVRLPSYRTLRSSGIRRLISYWGAPMSGLYSGWKLFLRRLDVRFSSLQPDRYVFQAQAMMDSAIRGRGIPPSKVSLLRSGIDHERFFPPSEPSSYAHEVFGIPLDRKIAYYSGHLHPRKGIDLMMEAAIELVGERGRTDVHFLLVGEEDAAAQYLPLLEGTPAEGHVTFGGYRSDVPEILRSVYVGLRPTKDWDSFPVSCMEMAACGVPMVVSEVGGLPETVEDGVSGRVIPVGEHIPLADEIEALLDDPERRADWSAAARKRILEHHTKDRFLDRLTSLVREVWEA